jgi:hypothetical protein
LRKGGCLGLLVPAHPRLFGTLDEVYEHRRRYTANGVRALLGDAGLEVESLRAFNMLGIAGWWTSSLLRRSQIDPGSLRAYEALVRVWRPIEDRVRPRWGLSIVARGRKRA